MNERWDRQMQKSVFFENKEEKSLIYKTRNVFHRFFPRARGKRINFHLQRLHARLEWSLTSLREPPRAGSSQRSTLFVLWIPLRLLHPVTYGSTDFIPNKLLNSSQQSFGHSHSCPSIWKSQDIPVRPLTPALPHRSENFFIHGPMTRKRRKIFNFN